MSATTALRSSTRGARTCLRLKASSCRVSAGRPLAGLAGSPRPARAPGRPRGRPAQQQLAVAVDDGQQVVEVVGHAAGQPADRLHLLRLPELLLQPPPLGDVLDDRCRADDLAAVADGGCRLANGLTHAVEALDVDDHIVELSPWQRRGPGATPRPRLVDHCPPTSPCTRRRGSTPRGGPAPDALRRRVAQNDLALPVGDPDAHRERIQYRPQSLLAPAQFLFGFLDRRDVKGDALEKEGLALVVQRRLGLAATQTTRPSRARKRYAARTACPRSRSGRTRDSTARGRRGAAARYQRVGSPSHSYCEKPSRVLICGLT